MKVSKIRIFLVLLLILVPFFSYSAFEYMTSGSARPLGLGAAFVAVAEGGENGFLNPAGLGFLRDRINFSTLYSPILGGLNDGTLYNASFNAASGFKDIGGFALNGQYLGISIQSLADIYREYHGILSYGRQLSSVIAVGGNIKYYAWNSSSQADASGYQESFAVSAVSFDLAGLYCAGDNISVGMMLMDFTQPVISSDQAKNEYMERLPVKIKLGLTFGIEKVLVALEGEGIQRRLNFRTGAERGFFNELLSVRIGMQFLNIVRGINFTTGLGFKFKNWLLVDYAFLYPVTGISDIWGTHRISVTFRK